MNKKAQGYTTVTTVEFFILLIIFGMLAYVTVNANVSNEINKIRSKDLGLSVSLINSFGDNVVFSYDLEEKKRVEFFDKDVEVSDEDGDNFEKSRFNLNKNVELEKNVVNDQFISVTKKEKKIEVK